MLMARYREVPTAAGQLLSSEAHFGLSVARKQQYRTQRQNAPCQTGCCARVGCWAWITNGPVVAFEDQCSLNL
ncbi:hypothetical protein GY45DRAFT_529072 [Cubamyces sp. BRFM 1775]|nr:hypothetical protein GY45DRAFT_529072 [Cubamyces sp. BRFM 1775]